MTPGSPLDDFIRHVFDHPGDDPNPEWYWASDAPEWAGEPLETTWALVEMFENAGERLAEFSDAQIGQGLWYLADAACSGIMGVMNSPTVPLELQRRVVRSWVMLYEQVFAVRCSPHLSNPDEPGANPLNVTCYMWWDLLPVDGRPSIPERVLFDREVLDVLERLLEIPHDACRESAIHGLGHWVTAYPDAAGIIDDFLCANPDLRPELAAYADLAKSGRIQ